MYEKGRKNGLAAATQYSGPQILRPPFQTEKMWSLIESDLKMEGYLY